MEGILLETNKKEIRIGETNINTYGSKMVIQKYFSAVEVLVNFPETNYSTITSYDRFKRGIIKNPYDKSIYNIGFIGEGKYKISEKGTPTPAYNTWRNMLQRCYDEKNSKKYPTYKDITVVEEWYNFQVFAKWMDENYYHVDGQRMELDKDILIKDNKVYSPETCIFVPHIINTLFLKQNSSRGKLPIGVSFEIEKKKYEARCSNINRKQKRIGRFSTIDDAFKAYKNYKEELIKQVANEYKEKIPTKLYNAMITYEVEITD